MTKTFLIEITISSVSNDKKKQAITLLKDNGFKRARQKSGYWRAIKTMESNDSACQIAELVQQLFKSIDNVSITLKTE